MIVYNVERKWFPKWEDADKHRKALGLKPNATIKVAVEHRDELAELLNALCDPPAKAGPNTPEQNALIDRAYVDPHKAIPDCIPQFLRKDWSVS